jgi:putative transposase
MKRGRFDEEQIVHCPAGDRKAICREGATFYAWKAKYGGMDVPMMQRVKELESENKRLKKMYAEERLKADILQESLSKKW